MNNAWRFSGRDLIPALVLFLALCWGETAQAKTSVFSTPHNLSASGGLGTSSGQPGVAFAGEQRVCVFCHVPHRATAGGPLWSRELLPEEPDLKYTPYQSTTINANPKPDKPTGASRLCLSCHDGTIALTQYTGTPLLESVKLQPGTAANLTTDLSDDHPISFSYTEMLAQASHLVSPSALPASVKVDKGGFLQCTSCHDPHDNQYGNFLVLNNGSPDKPGYSPGSQLCVACHAPTEWPASSHHYSQSPSLANGCLNCHSVHSAPGAVRLLKHPNDEDNCLASCHNGIDTDSMNVKPLFAAGMHRHPIDEIKGRGVHDENETLPAENYHVQCVDCHNPHQVNGSGAPLSNPPFIDGRLKGVRKDSLGGEADTEYEVCFKCHAGASSSKFTGYTETLVNRMILEPDQSYRFDLRNPSFHPVLTVRKGTGASLLLELQPGLKQIYCTDCHNNDQSAKAGGSGPNGPHGSAYEHILIAQYEMPIVGATRDPYNKNQYALCFRCHEELYVMGNGSAFSDPGVNHHDTHVKQRLIPCFACHDPHGTSQRMLATAQNNAHLINFNKDYAAGTVVATPVYQTLAPGKGNCTVNCHTVAGNNHAYSQTGVFKLLRQAR